MRNKYNCHKNIIFYLIFICFPFALYAEHPIADPKICLNMIVKNEREVIRRCLTTLEPFIDYWVIVDTGSTDGTQRIVREFMEEQGLPGELHEQPWVDFAYNRNEALKLTKGKGDYVLFIDADEYLSYEPGFVLPCLEKDYYYVNMSYSGTRYTKIFLINNHLDWKWEGVLHEVLSPSPNFTHAVLENVTNNYTTEGARSKDPKKYEKDAAILEAALKDHPDEARYLFYLAQSYRDCKNYPKALQAYEKRVGVGGWSEEVFYSLLQIAILRELMDEPFEKVIQSYLAAYQYRASRVEPLYHMARLYRAKKDFSIAYQIASLAHALPLSKDMLFVEQWMYDYGIALEISVSAFWIGKYEECQRLSLELLKRKDLPTEIKNLVEGNLAFANAKLVKHIIDGSDNPPQSR